MSREPRLKWTPRQARRTKRSAPPAGSPVTTMLLIGLFMLPLVALLYGNYQRRVFQHEGGVVVLQPTASGFTGPFEKGRIDLSFVTVRGRRHARLDLIEASGARSVLPPKTTITLDIPDASGRSRIAFHADSRSIVTERPVGQIAERTMLIIDEGRYRHVYALNGAHDEGMSR